MNTEQILSEILFRKGFYKEIDVPANTVEVWKNRFNNGKLSIERKEAILVLAGYRKIQESIWKKI